MVCILYGYLFLDSLLLILHFFLSVPSVLCTYAYRNVKNVKNFQGMFNQCNFNQDISQWDVSGAVDMSGMFRAAEYFNQPIGRWDLSGVKNVRFLFEGATSFDQNLTEWKLPYKNEKMFEGADAMEEVNKPVMTKKPFSRKKILAAVMLFFIIIFCFFQYSNRDTDNSIGNTCEPNPCENNGKCSLQGSDAVCDCKGIRFTGLACENAKD